MATYQSNARVRFYGANNQARAVFIPVRTEDGRLQRRGGKAANVTPQDVKNILALASDDARREVNEFLSKKRHGFSVSVRTELARLCRGHFSVDSLVSVN